MKDKNGIYYKKFCRRCNELFTPTSRYNRICDKCRIDSHKMGIIKYQERRQNGRIIDKGIRVV